MTIIAIRTSLRFLSITLKRTVTVQASCDVCSDAWKNMKVNSIKKALVILEKEGWGNRQYEVQSYFSVCPTCLRTAYEVMEMLDWPLHAKLQELVTGHPVDYPKEDS